MSRHADLVARQRADENGRDAEAMESAMREIEYARANLRRSRVQVSELRNDKSLVDRFVVQHASDVADVLGDQELDVLEFLRRRHRDVPDDVRFRDNAAEYLAAEIMRRDPGVAVEARDGKLVRVPVPPGAKRPRPPDDVFVKLGRADHLVRVLETCLVPAEETKNRIERRRAMREFVRGFANRYLLQDAFYAHLSAQLAQVDEAELDAVRELRERVPKAAAEMAQMTGEQYAAVCDCVLRHSKDRLAIDFPAWDCNVISDRVVCIRKKEIPSSGCAIQ